MKDRIAIGVFLALFAAAAWVNPWPVLTGTITIAGMSLLAFVAILLALAVVPAIRAIPAARMRRRYDARFAKCCRLARRIAAEHVVRLAAHPASVDIGELHVNSWDGVRSEFIDKVIAPHLDVDTRTELAVWDSVLRRRIESIVDDQVSAARK